MSASFTNPDMLNRLTSFHWADKTIPKLDDSQPINHKIKKSNAHLKAMSIFVKVFIDSQKTPSPLVRRQVKQLTTNMMAYVTFLAVAATTDKNLRPKAAEANEIICEHFSWKSNDFLTDSSGSLTFSSSSLPSVRESSSSDESLDSARPLAISTGSDE